MAECEGLFGEDLFGLQRGRDVRTVSVIGGNSVDGKLSWFVDFVPWPRLLMLLAEDIGQ